MGKSECVLDLVERGHRLVADDVVIVTKRGNDSCRWWSPSPRSSAPTSWPSSRWR
ncbi:MAG: hypothetical protein ACM32J_01995 [Rhizobacter sp.]